MAAADSITVDHSPTLVNGILAGFAGLIALSTLALVSVLTLVLGILALGILVVGALLTGSRLAVSIGVAGLVLGVIAAGILGAPIEVLLVGIVGAVVALDCGHNAITLGNQLGRSSITISAELAHAATSVLVGAFGVLVVYGAYLVGPAEQPMTAVIFFLLAAFCFAWLMRS